MKEFKIVGEYENKKTKAIIRIIEENGKFWFMLLPKNSTIKYYDTKEELEKLIVDNGFTKIEE